YLAAFESALAVQTPNSRQPGGFRGTAQGKEWAVALDELGRWAYEWVIGPLVRVTRGWHDREAHVVLVPLGELGAVPYAAAWTEDPALRGGRRYAIDDLVLTQAVSARLLTEVSRRPRLPLHERVVLVADPTGEFPYPRPTP